MPSPVQRRYPLILLLSFLCASPSHSQKGTAPNGYYPPSYNGSMFTGAVESTDAGQLTLLYASDRKQERFVGRPEAPCIWTDKAGAAHAVEVAAIPTGIVLTAFYKSFTTKSGNQKIKENLILAISYAEQNGKKIPDDKRVVVSCSQQRFLQFRVF
jgi:hypothetical protein